tara:strand:+ start:479 stop:973 length:495 start_codon:yes stop_codon:yes gene_type:complete
MKFIQTIVKRFKDGFYKGAILPHHLEQYKDYLNDGSTKNSVFSLRAYKHDGLWVFDDHDRGLVKEPFVAGADTMFDIMSGNVLPNVNNTQCTIIFSANPIPDHEIHVKHIADLGEDMGDMYEVVKAFTPALNTFNGFQFWLCPALLSFFKSAPENIYVSVISSS